MVINLSKFSAVTYLGIFYTTKLMADMATLTEILNIITYCYLLCERSFLCICFNRRISLEKLLCVNWSL